MENKFKQCADLIKNCSALVITSGAGMGVDSGLPEFRGAQGFWKAYPPYKKLGMNFINAANPKNFLQDPKLGWGFYGHRLQTYRETEPHQGFHILQKWIKKFQLDYFVVTSNVDGHFQKVGFPEEKIVEIHGSIHHLQCLSPCCHQIWDNKEEVPVDMETMRATYIPKCIYCEAIARPNILMFGDFSWISTRSNTQQSKYDAFRKNNYSKNIVVVEMGAGTAIPSIRHMSEMYVYSDKYEATMIRINPREAYIDSPNISLDCGSLEALEKIDKQLNSLA